MSVFDLKGGNGNNWNYSDNTKANYSEMLEGTVVEISNPQSINYATKQPETWPDGNPKRNLRLILKTQAGELSWTFAPRSAAATACLAALDPQNNRDAVSIEEMLGKMIRIQTQGGVYNQAHPRPWWVTLLGDGDASAVRGLVDLSKMAGQQTAPAPAQVAAPQPAPAPVAQAMNQAAQAMGFQQPPQAMPAQVTNDPTGGYYDADIPF